MSKRFPVNIPNLLSLYRLISFPFILILALNYKEKHFTDVVVTSRSFEAAKVPKKIFGQRYVKSGKHMR